MRHFAYLRDCLSLDALHLIEGAPGYPGHVGQSVTGFAICFRQIWREQNATLSASASRVSPLPSANFGGGSAAFPATMRSLANRVKSSI